MSDFMKGSGFPIDQEKLEAERAKKVEREAERDAFLAEQRRKREAEQKAERSEREKKFREDCKTQFLEANDFATEADFARLYDTMRDEILLQNWRNSFVDSRETTRAFLGGNVKM